jgi:hypothetical protein
MQLRVYWKSQDNNQVYKECDTVPEDFLSTARLSSKMRADKLDNFRRLHIGRYYILQLRTINVKQRSNVYTDWHNTYRSPPRLITLIHRVLSLHRFCFLPTGLIHVHLIYSYHSHDSRPLIHAFITFLGISFYRSRILTSHC